MVSERSIKLSLGPLAILSFLASLVTLAIAAALEAKWRDEGFPNKSYRDRERILLTAGIVGIVVSIYSAVGTIAFSDRVAFGIFPHLIAFTIVFLLALIGASSLTALTRHASCGAVSWGHCRLAKTLVAFGWIETIFAFLILIFVLFLGIKARSGAGMRKSALVDA